MDKLLDNKLKYEDILNNKLNIDYFTSEFNNKVEFIKDEVDLRIDSLITQLNGYRINFFKQLEETKEFVASGIVTSENIDVIKDKYKDLSINDNNEYEAKLKELEDDIQKLKDKIPIVDYFISDYDIQIDVIGRLRVFKEILDINNYNSSDMIPLSKNRLALAKQETIFILDYESGKLISELKGHNGNIHCLTELSNNRLASSDNTIKIWDLNRYNCIISLFGHKKNINCLLKLPNSRLASASDDGTIKIWNTGNYELVTILSGHYKCIDCLEYLPGNRLVSSSDATLTIWNLNDNSLLNTLIGHREPLRYLRSIPDSVLVSVDYGTKIKIWNINNYKCTDTLNIQYDECFLCLISLSNRKLITSCYDGIIKVWNMNDCNLIREIDAHDQVILSLILLKNDERLISLTSDEYKVWNMNDYTCIKTVKFFLN